MPMYISHNEQITIPSYLVNYNIYDKFLIDQVYYNATQAYESVATDLCNYA